MTKRFTVDDGLEDVLCWEINDKENEDMTCGECAKLLNELHEENEELKQFQEKVAEVIESKMGDNVCNDYKMEVLKEIWNELELDEVWFE